MVKPSKNKKHRILHIITSLDFGGAQMMLFKLLSEMDRAVFEPTVVSITDIGRVGKSIQSMGIPVYNLNLNPKYPSPLAFWKFLNLTVKKIRPTLIQGWMYHANIFAQILNFFLSTRVPMLWNIRHSIHNLDHEKKMTAIIIRLCAYLSKTPSRIIYNSKISVGQHEALGYASHKRVIIPNGFDTNIFSPSEEAKIRIRKELGLSPNATLIGLFARHHPMKDHPNFIRAAAHLSKSYPDVHFLLAGKNVDTNNGELMNLICDLKLNEKFHLMGDRSDMNDLTASLDIASSSSFGEAFPNVIGEAMACQIPCVVTDVGDSGWLVGDTGRVVPPMNPEALAEAWKDLLDIGLEGRRKLGEKARDRIIKDFSLNHIASKYESLYLQLLCTK
jgi:glycosyltransferase involved in cell wall biosynthesis